MTTHTTPNVSLADLLAVIGEKEVTIYSLRSEIAQLRAELAKKQDNGDSIGS